MPPKAWAWFQSLERDSVCSSLPATLQRGIGCDCFNLLSEILFVQATLSGPRQHKDHWFQSLERDSVCSSMTERIRINKVQLGFQSLERDSVCSSMAGMTLSWINFQFQSLERDSVCSSLAARRGWRTGYLFQSLERDSVCSSHLRLKHGNWYYDVSIS